jgi:hypothetical protein
MEDIEGRQCSPKALCGEGHRVADMSGPVTPKDSENSNFSRLWQPFFAAAHFSGLVRGEWRRLGY